MSLEGVVERGVERGRLDVVAGLGDVADVEVVGRAEHVLEHPGERLAEGGGRVLHARPSGAPARTPTPRCAAAAPRWSSPSGPGDQRDGHEEPESQEAGGEHAVDARQPDLPAAHQRVGDAGAGDAAGRVDRRPG